MDIVTRIYGSNIDFYNITGNIVLKNPNTTYNSNSFRSDYIGKIIKKSN